MLPTQRRISRQGWWCASHCLVAFGVALNLRTKVVNSPFFYSSFRSVRCPLSWGKDSSDGRVHSLPPLFGNLFHFSRGSAIVATRCCVKESIAGCRLLVEDIKGLVSLRAGYHSVRGTLRWRIHQSTTHERIRFDRIRWERSPWTHRRIVVCDSLNSVFSRVRDTLFSFDELSLCLCHTGLWGTKSLHFTCIYSYWDEKIIN